MHIKSMTKTLALGLVVPLLFAACASQQQQKPASKPAPTPAPVRTGDYGPSHMSYDEAGKRWVKGSMAFPTGVRQSSGLLLEKIVPAEVSMGQTFDYTYNVINLTDYTISDVQVTDNLSSGFAASKIDPKPTKLDGNMARWSLGDLGPKEKRVIHVAGTASAEGTITTCGTATYVPILCEPIKVVKPALQLVKKAPADVLTCDVIPMTLTVRNSGSSVLTDVKVTDTMPEGLTSGGKSSFTFDAGTLAPGASRDFAFNANASKTGKYVNTAKATAAQGVSAEASSTTVVHQPVLTIACETPAERYIGRPFDVCFTVVNKGDVASAGTVVEITLPAGVTVSSTSAGGVSAGGKITWNVASLAAEGTTKVCATVTASTAGEFAFSASAKGNCAAAVTAACRTRVIGIPAILLEVVDLEDPIEVGKNVTYEIEVTNQGSAPGTNIKLVCTMEDTQSFVSGSGATSVSADGKTITLGNLATLAPKAKAIWRIVVRADKAANVRFKTSLTSDQLTRPVSEDESTNQY